LEGGRRFAAKAALVGSAPVQVGVGFPHRLGGRFARRTAARLCVPSHLARRKDRRDAALWRDGRACRSAAITLPSLARVRLRRVIALASMSAGDPAFGRSNWSTSACSELCCSV
jgi:hypothetical protein